MLKANEAWVITKKYDKYAEQLARILKIFLKILSVDAVRAELINFAEPTFGFG